MAGSSPAMANSKMVHTRLLPGPGVPLSARWQAIAQREMSEFADPPTERLELTAGSGYEAAPGSEYESGYESTGSDVAEPDSPESER